MRKLASIELIDKLEPIPNADNILKATVKGWECVVAKKDNFSVGDKVIYIEVDSVCPPKPEFSFLKERKYRVKTIKLRKQISQGLILPMSYLKKDYAVGTDVTAELGITKYDPQAEAEEKLIMKPKHQKSLFSPLISFLLRFEWFRKLYLKLHITNCAFPTEIVKKTDEERIQNLSIAFEDWKKRKVPFYGTEKIDGCSGTFFLDDKLFGVCSRNVWLRKEDNSHYWEVARRFQLEETLNSLKKTFNAKRVVIQGEIIGQNIQGNKYKISGFDFYVFNVIIDGLKVDQESMMNICKEYNLKTVPLLYKGYTLPETIAELVDVSKGKSKLLDTQDMEGIVWRNYNENVSFKALNPNFLLKEE